MHVGFADALRHSLRTDGPRPAVTPKDVPDGIRGRGPSVSHGHAGEAQPMTDSRKKRHAARTFTAVIHRCPETRLYLGFVPGFPGAYTQAESLDELCANLRDVIALLLENGGTRAHSEFVGVQTVAIA